MIRGHVKFGQGQKALVFQQMQQKLCGGTLLLLSQCWIHLAVLLQLKRAGLLMSRSFKVDGIQMPLWGIAWLTCMQNVGAWSRLGMPYLDDVKCMGMERKLWNFLNICAEGVKPDDITFVCLMSACSHAGLVDEEGMCCYVSMVTDYMISAKLEHYTCMVDLLGHAGRLQEAESMVMAVPCKPHVAA